MREIAVVCFHTVFSKQHLLRSAAAALCAVLLCTTARATETAPPRDDLSHETIALEPPRAKEGRPLRDLRPLATFGITVGIQTFGVAIACIFAGPLSHFSDRSIEIGWGVVAGVAPAVSGTVSWLAGRSAPLYNSPIAGILGGAYIGAAMGYLATFFTVRKDNPKVDGRYDPIYFDRNDGAEALLYVAAYGLAPVFLPAIGAAVGHLIARRPKGKPDRIAVRPPTLSIARNPSHPATLTVSIRLLSASF